MSETWTEWGVDRRTLNEGRQVAVMRNHMEAEGVCRNWADNPSYDSSPVVVSRTVQAGLWIPTESAGE